MIKKLWDILKETENVKDKILGDVPNLEQNSQFDIASSTTF